MVAALDHKKVAVDRTCGATLPNLTGLSRSSPLRRLAWAWKGRRLLDGLRRRQTLEAPHEQQPLETFIDHRIQSVLDPQVAQQTIDCRYFGDFRQLVIVSEFSAGQFVGSLSRCFAFGGFELRRVP